MSPKSIVQLAEEEFYAVGTPGRRLLRTLSRTMDTWDAELLKEIYGFCKHDWHYDEDFSEEKPGLVKRFTDLRPSELAWIENRTEDKPLPFPKEVSGPEDDGMTSIPDPVPVAGSRGRLAGLVRVGQSWRLVLPTKLALEVARLERRQKDRLAWSSVAFVPLRDSEGGEFSETEVIGKKVYQVRPHLFCSAPRYRVTRSGKAEGFVEISLSMFPPRQDFSGLHERDHAKLNSMAEACFGRLAAYFERLISVTSKSAVSPIQYYPGQPHIFINRRSYPLSDIQHAFVVTFIELAIKTGNQALSDVTITAVVEKNVKSKRFKTYGGDTGLKSLGTRVKDIVASKKPWVPFIFQKMSDGKYKIPAKMFRPAPTKKALSLTPKELKQLK